jgi:phytoene dehydrogenase-like protein
MPDAMPPTSAQLRVTIIGAGLAGLACAITLHCAGAKVTLLEASDRAGGRVATDEVDGFLLDRGFQVFNDAYPEAKRFLDLPALKLRPFNSGAIIATPSGKLARLMDPRRHPMQIVKTATSGVASLGDVFRALRLVADVTGEDVDSLLKRPQTSTLESLRARGFSEGFINQFFRPFFGGVFLEDELSTSSRAFEVDFAMFARGRACLPERGMQAIPEQLAASLPAGVLRLNARVTSIANRLVALESGETIVGDAVVIATDADVAARLAPEHVKPIERWTGCTSAYYAAPLGAIREPTLMLNGTGRGSINNVAPLSAAQPTYSTSVESLVAVSLIGSKEDDDALLDAALRSELRTAFSLDASAWRLLRINRVPKALPDQRCSAMSEVPKRSRLRERLYLCGDHVDHRSINGALASGRRAAEAILGE